MTYAQIIIIKKKKIIKNANITSINHLIKITFITYQDTYHFETIKVTIAPGPSFTIIRNF